MCAPYTVDSKLIEDMESYHIVKYTRWNLTRTNVGSVVGEGIFLLDLFWFICFDFSIQCFMIQLLQCDQHNAHTFVQLQWYYNVSAATCFGLHWPIIKVCAVV